MAENENNMVLEYSKARIYQRVFSFFIDLFLAVLLGMIINSLCGLVTSVVPKYQEVLQERIELQDQSGLFDENQKLWTLSLEGSDMTIQEKKELLSTRLDEFYHNDVFFEDDTFYQSYQKRKSEAVNEKGELLFQLISGSYVEKDFSDDVYYSFYQKEFENYASAALSHNVRFADLSNLIVRISVIEIVLSMSVGFALSFVIMPLILKRGRKTIGMYLFKISLVGGDALNVRGKTLLFRNVLLLLIGYWLTIFTFGIPWLVSLTMMTFSKTGQDFFDYMSGTYVVSTKDKDIYLDYAEYLARTEESKKASIENRDFEMTR
ncbi:MAG: RDD family protein [Candidatus Enterosoma sp.]|nr:RDD family protein [bacterium]MDY5322278.1 RDD family protein [Candidatus Enterosoma sp.]MDY5909601.1 RDD family protein [Candidatus Enterosoma sp.]MDY6063660.1 RDD family protein [Candidatus Enterosoma sp.]